MRARPDHRARAPTGAAIPCRCERPASCSSPSHPSRRRARQGAVPELPRPRRLPGRRSRAARAVGCLGRRAVPPGRRGPAQAAPRPAPQGRGGRLMPRPTGPPTVRSHMTSSRRAGLTKEYCDEPHASGAGSRPTVEPPRSRLPRTPTARRAYVAHRRWQRRAHERSAPRLRARHALASVVTRAATARPRWGRGRRSCPGSLSRRPPRTRAASARARRATAPRRSSWHSTPMPPSQTRWISRYSGGRLSFSPVEVLPARGSLMRAELRRASRRGRSWNARRRGRLDERRQVVEQRLGVERRRPA